MNRNVLCTLRTSRELSTVKKLQIFLIIIILLFSLHYINGVHTSSINNFKSDSASLILESIPLKMNETSVYNSTTPASDNSATLKLSENEELVKPTNASIEVSKNETEGEPVKEESKNDGDSRKASDCYVETWNNVRTDIIPNLKHHQEFANKDTANFLYHKHPSVLSAFMNKEEIIVTLTSENQLNRTVYCRYYDCRRREINDSFESLIAPRHTVFCARRPGAKFISLSTAPEEVPEYSVPIVPRMEDKPPHYFTVCLATLYGDEPKFLQIVDFIEYYKLQGATFFHIYVKNVTDYDRVLLDDYVRTGDVELIKMHDHYWRADYMWHNVQINDCHHRNKHFSKWTAFVDIDERIEMNSSDTKIIDYLETVQNSSIINLHFLVKWVIKDEDTPLKYENEQQLKNEMLFHKYQNTSKIGALWDQPKCIIRPEKVAVMTIHGPIDIYSGEQLTMITEDIGFVRHYRSVQERFFPGTLKRMMSHAPFSILSVPKWIDEQLTPLILNRVKWVYDIADANCAKKQKAYNVEGMSAPCWLEALEAQE